MASSRPLARAILATAMPRGLSYLPLRVTFLIFLEMRDLEAG